MKTIRACRDEKISILEPTNRKSYGIMCSTDVLCVRAAFGRLINLKQKGKKMKVGQIISIVDELKENDINEEIKLFWLNEVEGRIDSEIFKRSTSETKPLVSLGEELSAPAPYLRLYVLYLEAMIAFSKGDHDAYFKINGEFEKAFSEYSRYVIRNRA